MADSTFVARERELNRLNDFLAAALAGKTQVCFITGEAGEGKSALLGEFIRRAQLAHPDLSAATSQCNAQAGTSDPYLPFRDLLATLASSPQPQGRVASRTLIEILLEHGPNLLAVFNLRPGLIEVISRLIAECIISAPDQLKPALQRTNSGTTDRLRFRQALSRVFNRDEIQTLCFDLNVNWDNLAGETEEGKIRELTAYLERRHRLGELIDYCRNARPHEDWSAIVGVMLGDSPDAPTNALANEVDQLVELRSRLQAGRRGEIEAEQRRDVIIQQFSSVMRELTKQHHVILALDDLHWGDHSSLDLLFHLARNFKDAPLLILGAYRPSDIQPDPDGKTSNKMWGWTFRYLKSVMMNWARHGQKNTFMVGA